MAKCNCSGSQCGCLIVAGSGTVVNGVGTKASPFSIDVDLSEVEFDDRIEVDNSTTVELSKLGEGSIADPLILKADVVLISPDATRWTLEVANDGTVTAVEL